MPGLPWVRLDSNIASHDKILSLLGERDGVKAAFMYVCGLGYCGGHGTDGLIRYGALPFIHGIRRLAELRVKHAQHVAPTIAHAKTLVRPDAQPGRPEDIAALLDAMDPDSGRSGGHARARQRTGAA
jgi:hypothetical protein